MGWFGGRDCAFVGDLRPVGELGDVGEVVASWRPPKRRVVRAVVVALVSYAAVIVLALVTGQPRWAWLLYVENVAAALLLGWVTVAALYRLVWWLRTVVVVSDRAVLRWRGVLRHRCDWLELGALADVELRQSRRQRLARSGDLVLTTLDSQVVELVSVPGVARVYEFLDSVARTNVAQARVALLERSVAETSARVAMLRAGRLW